MTENKIIKWAFGISILLHVIFMAATWRIPFIPQPDPAKARANDDFEVVMMVEDDPLQDISEPETPSTFVSIPERMESEEAPEKADYLALFQSIAADNKEGGDSEVPSAEIESEITSVDIKKQSSSSSDGVQYAIVPLPNPESGQSAPEAARDVDSEKEIAEGEEVSEKGLWDLANAQEEEPPAEVSNDTPGGDAPEIDDWWGGEAPSILKDGDQKDEGDKGYDYSQVAQGHVGSGVTFDGTHFQLNTYEWDFAPWMTRFTSDLRRNWIPPPAFYMGLLSGKTVVRIVIERDGTVTVLDVVDSEGHQSLHDASTAAFRSFAPYMPLPGNFPEEVLVIRFTLIYSGRGY